MRIHTDTVLSGDLYRAASFARVTIERANLHKSRSRDHAWDILLSGESRRHAMRNDFKAATWDQWGVFLNDLFGMDDALTIPNVYATVEDFDYATSGRFEDGWPADAHGDHRFRFSGTPFHQGCVKCSATFRWSPR